MSPVLKTVLVALSLTGGRVLPPPLGQGEDPGQERIEDLTWPIGSPRAAGFSETALRRLTGDIAAGMYSNVHALLIEHDGALVYERYFEGTDERWGESIGQRKLGAADLHDLRSISKSVTALLLGIALEEKHEQAVARGISGYLPKIRLEHPQRKITLHQALTMTAGLAWDETTVSYKDATNDELRLYRSRTPVQLVLSRPLVDKPGDTWNYSGGLTQVLADVITFLTRKRIDKYAEEALFKPLGITDYEWLGPPAWRRGNPAAMSGLRLSARALAKIGSVFLAEGLWKGRRVVPKKWIQLSSKRWVRDLKALPNSGIWGYGYHWWVGRLPSGPKVIAGMGNGNQRLYLLPDQKLGITLLAGDYNGESSRDNRLLLRVLAARREKR